MLQNSKKLSNSLFLLFEQKISGIKSYGQMELCYTLHKSINDSALAQTVYLSNDIAMSFFPALQARAETSPTPNGVEEPSPGACPWVKTAI